MPTARAKAAALLLVLLCGAAAWTHASAEQSGKGHCIAEAGEASATPAPRDLSPLLEPIVERHKVPGMVAAMVEGSRTVGLGAAGVRRKGSDAKVTVGDRFHIGSCTKSMTATLCGILVEEGKLSWGTTLEQAFPELVGSMRPEFRAVTLEQLLSHRGGVPAELDRNGLWRRLRSHQGSPTEARRLLVEAVLAGPPDAEPGTKYIYSNAGYAVAGYMVEKATGQAWEALLTERLFKPLGMTSAGFGAPGSRDTLDEPRGHSASGEPVEPGPRADNPPAIGPGGTVHCSIGDWAKYISEHLCGEQGGSSLLKAETFQKLHTPAGNQPRYALGWLVAKRQWGGGDVLTHTGTNTRWFAVAWLAPKRGFAVLAACNQGGDEADKACDNAAWTLIQDLLRNRGGE